jgi:hypothetical protein
VAVGTGKPVKFQKTSGLSLPASTLPQ